METRLREGEDFVLTTEAQNSWRVERGQKSKAERIGLERNGETMQRVSESGMETPEKKLQEGRQIQRQVQAQEKV